MRDFQLPGRSAVHAVGGLCATSHPLAARVAVDILAAGGNAADAALAAAVLLGVCEPHMCGLGGDAFVLVKPAGEERVVGINGSGRAPAGLSAAALRAAGHTAMPLAGALAVTLPGAVDAFCRLAADWGRLGLARCLAPAIAHAEEGVPVAPRVAFDLAEASAVLAGRARDHYMAGGRPLATGDRFRAPGLAEVLRRIARDGRAGFYEGEVAADMVASLAAAGGCHTLADLAATVAEPTEPVRSRYRDVELIEHPPNGQGATACLMLNILGRFDLAGLDPRGAARAHLEAEAAKLAYDARDRFLADPAHVRRLEHMLAPATAARLAALIDPARALPDPAAAAAAVHLDTVCLSAVDRDGMAVSLIHSIYHAFGAGLASDRFGILFQNRGAGFTLAAGHPNEAGGGKRPLHTIIPAMLARGGRVVMAFGVMGGAYQPCGHARLVSNLVDFGMELQEAVDAPRSFAGAGGMEVERGHAADVLDALRGLGQRARWASRPLGGAQAVVIDHARGILVGASDPRKDGIALGL
ncbi:MAG: gamma-glutamyltransferase family protein [Rhodobacteraceae bacterium]|nr:gamma-glutamyltransferase family protein [Paracoccaceae bacterium]